MAFSISFVEDNFLPERQDNLKLGKIILGDYEERFEASLSYWSTEDYRKHWEHALHRIVFESNKSCLITLINNPGSSNYLYWWPIYKNGSSVFIQNQILFLKQIKPKFNPNNPYLSVPDRKTINEEGLEISEWELSIREILEYLRLL